MQYLGILLVVLWMSFTNVAEARTVTGWSKGKQTKVKLVHVGGAEVEEKTAKAFREMARAARKDGIHLAIRSGFRSHDRQDALYRRYKAGWGHPAARPGYSNHQSGKAVDIYIEDYRIYQWLTKHAGAFGFKRTVKKEAWHWEYVGIKPKPQRARKTTS
jgi:LAS superfamily LD-carboxypeptidase LdcB